jgi:hypothetical protein
VIDSLASASSGQPRYQTLCCQNQKERNMKKIKTLAVTGATALLLTWLTMAQNAKSQENAGKLNQDFLKKSKDLNMIQNIAKLNWINKPVQWNLWKHVMLNV